MRNKSLSLLLGFISIVFTGCFFFKSVSPSVTTRESIDLIADLLADQIDKDLNIYGNVMKSIGSAVVTAVNIEDALIEGQKLFPKLNLLFNTDVEGSIRSIVPWNKGKSFYNQNIGSKGYFKEPMKKKDVTISSINEDFGYPALVLTNPVYLSYTGTPVFDGITGAVLPIETLLEELFKVRLGKTGSVLIVDKEGGLWTDKESTFSGKKKFSEIGEDPKLVEIESSMIRQEQGLSELSLKEGKYIISFSPISIMKWSLAVLIAAEEVSE